MIEITVDTYQAMDSNRIPLTEYRELVMAHNCNLEYSDDSEEWFEFENDDGLTIIDENEFLDMYV
jgi:hypothetical protein